MKDNNKDKEILRNVLKFLNQYDLSSDFRIYTIVYHYISGINVKLYNDVKQLVNSNLVNNENLEDLYDKYFLMMDTETSVSIQIKRVIDKIQQYIDEILNELQNKRNQLSNDVKEKRILSALKKLKNCIESIKRFDDNIIVCKKEIKNIDEELQELRNKVMLDFLTDCYNRLWLSNYCKQIIKQKYTLVFIDLDNFKDVNDNYGHLIGDDVLRYVAKIFITYASKYQGYVVRYGGDEFLMIFENAQEYNIRKLMESVIKEINLKKFIIKRTDKKFKISFSYAIQSKTVSNKKQFEELIKDVDQMMYKFKISKK